MMKYGMILMTSILALVMAGQSVAQAQNARFQAHSNGLVTDTTTGLSWMRCSVGQEWNGVSCSGAATRHTWDSALAMAGEITFLGHSDWRLPTRDELNTLVHCSSQQRSSFNDNGYGGHCLGNYLKPTVRAEIFPNTPDSWFWSSSAYQDSKVNAWVLGTGNGALSGNHHSTPLRVRLVRD